MRRDLARALDNCMSAIRHARNLRLPIAFTRTDARLRIDGLGALGVDFRL